MKKNFILLLTAALFSVTGISCGEDWTHHAMPDYEKPKPDEPDKPDDPDDPDKPIPVAKKPVVLWIDAEANFTRLRNKTNITNFLEKAHDTGFNTIVVDVKPVQGDVLYDSDFLPQCTELHGGSVPDRGFDYLQFFIDEARRLDMRITVSTTIMTMGLPASKTGPSYTDPEWAKLTCVEYLPSGLHDINETTEWGVFSFLNPVLPQVREYVMKMVEEVTRKYDFDGYALDYCRYCNLHSDFSQASKVAFEQYAGVTVADFPAEIYTYNAGGEPVPGKYYNQWIEWRASVVQGYVKEIKERIKAIKPNVDIEYWAASWWPLPHTGQNWASANLDSSSSFWWATPNYYKTGFAEHLDIFQLGAYLPRVYGENDAESVEYAINKAKRLINDDCTLYGTISCDQASFDIESAVYLCLMETQGVMVFELSHILANQKWDAIKAGIDRAEKELGIQVPDKE